MLLAELVDRFARETQDQTAVACSDGELTYGQLMEDVRALAGELAAVGISKGDRGLILPVLCNRIGLKSNGR